MKQVQINGREVLLAKVPEDAWDFKLQYSELENKWILTYKTPWRWKVYKNENWNWTVSLDGSWRILGSGKASEITEEEWGEVVEGTVSKDKQRHLFRYYISSYPDSWVTTATSSGHSFLSHHGYEPSQTIILVKQ